ncbi:MAG: hypothetical protein EPN97_14875 [Alphaproteobacteria bacterium]|nr:MAG: hypothetical protein EPN97_14875 [Alphaproteobacteria bacterium]
MSGSEGRFKNILEGDEVERFLKQFVVSDAERARMLAADPKANVGALPQNIEQVLSDVKKIWSEKGFLAPNELKAALIDRYLPDADPKVKSYIHQIESARGAPETTTGYLGKEHAYSATGLAHLYAKETGRPIAMIEADFSNMGGTNKHFTAMLEREGVTGAQAVKQGMHMTDQAVALLCKSLTSDLADNLPKGAKIVPIRTGGDEVRILITGVEDKKELTRLTALMHAGVEKQVAAMGLQDHAHLKAATDPVRNGFGIALAAQDMRTIENPQTLVQELDARINEQKRSIGLARLGQIDTEMARESVEQKINRGALTVPEGQTREQFVAAQVDELAKAAKTSSELLHSRNPQHNPALQGGSSGFDGYVKTASETLRPGPLTSTPLPGVLSAPEPIGERRPEGVRPLAPLEERWNALATQNLEREGATLSATDRHMLSLSVAGLSAQDPSAQTFMPKIVGPTVEAYAAETEEFRRQWKPEDPAVRSALSAAGLKSVAEITPQAMAVSFHNLAGLNSALGHHQADIVLRSLSGDIIENSLKAAGVPPGPPKPYAIAHHGGGNFSVMIQPGGTGPDGKPWFTSPEQIAKAELEIKQRTAEMNKVGVAEFLASKGVTITEETRAQLPKTFGDIQDPKLREAGAVTGRVNGLQAESAAAPLQLERDGHQRTVDGFGFMSRLRNAADVKLEAQRTTILLAQAVQAGVEAKIATKEPPKPPPKGPKNGGGTGDGGGSAPVAPKKTPPKPVAPASNKPAPETKPVVEAKTTVPEVKTPAQSKFTTPAPDAPATRPVVEEPVASRSGRAQGRAATGVGVAAVGLDIAQGHYGQAMVGASMQVGLNPNTYKAAATLTAETGSVAKSLGFIAKKVPLLGAAVTLGFVAYEVGSNIYDGNYTKAVTAAGAGAAETLGSVVGFGVGDLAREGVREAIVQTSGEAYAPNKSGLRSLIETGVDVGSKALNGDPKAAGPATQAENRTPGRPSKPPTMG